MLISDHRRGTMFIASTRDGSRIEMIEHPDGSLGIAVDGHILDGWKWPAGSVEHCMRVYLDLVHRDADFAL